MPPGQGYHLAMTNRKEKLKMKNTKTTEKIILIIMGILGIAGLVLLLISMFGNIASNLPLTCALACVGTAGVLNTVMLIMRKRAENG